MHPHQIRKRTIKGYYFASSIQEAIAYLMAHHGQSQVIGGGTLLLPMVQRNGSTASYLADVSRVSSICRIMERDTEIVIGGANTFARLQHSDIIRARVPLLCQAAEQISSPQIRHLATLGGNVVSAHGNAHGAVALMALGAEVEITNSTGSQWLPIRSLFVQRGVSRVDSASEIVTAFRVPALNAGQGMAMASLPAAYTWGRSSLLLALNIRLYEDSPVPRSVALAVGSTSSAPVRLDEIEKRMVGLALDEAKTAALLSGAIRADAIEQHRLGDAADEAYDDIPELAAEILKRALHMGLSNSPPASVDRSSS
jgi:CO/xanthine dehydrogenase FAD-binding subunit